MYKEYRAKKVVIDIWQINNWNFVCFKFLCRCLLNIVTVLASVTPSDRSFQIPVPPTLYMKHLLFKSLLNLFPFTLNQRPQILDTSAMGNKH